MSVRMWTQLVTGLHRLTIVLALAVALVATGFAHRAPAPQDEALAFALANGATLADFCADDLGTGPHGGDCLACQITGSTDLPSSLGPLVALELAYQARIVAPRETRALVRVRDPAHAPQGPPAA